VGAALIPELIRRGGGRQPCRRAVEDVDRAGIDGAPDILEGDAYGEIIAQVGALMKSKRPDNPLAGLPIRKMILAGSSASAAVVVNYLPVHMVQRLADLSPIYDGFMPTSNGASLRMVDVPMIQVPTMREVFQGNGPARLDGDAPGNQFRIYEFAGMAHIDSRDAVAYYPDPCKLPISRFPLAAYMSVALDHLFKWVDKGTVPPRAVVVPGVREREFPAGSYGLPTPLIVGWRDESHDRMSLNDVLRELEIGT
jgi:hypothetical protein